MKRIVQDVTTLMNWRGRFVGIARTEAEFARFLAEKYQSDVKFIIFNKFNKKFYEVPKYEVIEQIKFVEGKSADSYKASNSESIIFKQQSISKKLKWIVVKIISKLPGKLGDIFYSLAKRSKGLYYFLNHYFANKRKQVQNLKKKISNNMSATNRNIKFPETFMDKDDIYVSMGLDWDDKDLNFMYNLKKLFGFKMVLFCYDLIPVKFPHLCVMSTFNGFSKYFVQLSWCSDLVLCISKNSQNDLIEFAEENAAPKPKSDTVTLGSNLNMEIANKINISNSEKYILFVSTIEARKNHDVLYKAYLRLINMGVKDLPKLKIVGMQGWGVNDLYFNLQNDPSVKDKIEILHNVGEAELINLYKNCMFTVFPSFYEGWGLPISEGLLLGKFCLSSNASSLPEVGKDFVEYIEPYDTVKWSERILYYYNHPDKLLLKENYIKENYKPQTWEQFSKDFLKLLEQYL